MIERTPAESSIASQNCQMCLVKGLGREHHTAHTEIHRTGIMYDNLHHTLHNQQKIILIKINHSHQSLLILKVHMKTESFLLGGFNPSETY